MRLLIVAAGVVLGLAAAVAITQGERAARGEVLGKSFVQALLCQKIQSPHGRPAPYVIAEFLLPGHGIDNPHRVQEVWIDLSLSANNFAPGTFIGVPADSKAQPVVVPWFGLMPGVRHYYRLNARIPSGWVELGRGVFDTPDCGVVSEYRCEVETEELRVVFDVPPATASGDPAIQQWLDLSLLDNGFMPRTFIGAGPLAVGGPNQYPNAVHFWDGILQGQQHFWRINVLHQSGAWRVSESGTFWPMYCQGLPDEF